ncbi:phosphoribosylglycinamide formyltransferase [Phormidium sp. FACHB-592]|uniref:Phosphoribosylglycinamide formyltransferase n=1 Tax=Stenomitos frigidus AS-A4 TaxID=2933935 RepID=A0ABV0KJP2_9CYAN|nr:phosphoribosylglycinamide formyltransferase [Phormidium sp. FACHB-592]MBD2074447.1 phosphoribosylglycinamide formyltransferase [Phormidium sp. FACHB-592]
MSLEPVTNHVTPIPSLVAPEVASNSLQNASLLKLGVMASGSGSNFEAIAQAIADQQLHAQVNVLLYNNPGAKAAARADRWGIPAVLLNHREFESREALDEAIVETLRQHDVEWVIMAGWMRIVTPVLINAFPRRILNIHPSLLPSFKGNRAVEQALAAGVKITGCTVHLVVPEVDSGDIIMQAAVPILPNDTLETLHDRIHTQEYCIFPKAIALAAQVQPPSNA